MFQTAQYMRKHQTSLSLGAGCLCAWQVPTETPRMHVIVINLHRISEDVP